MLYVRERLLLKGAVVAEVVTPQKQALHGSTSTKQMLLHGAWWSYVLFIRFYLSVINNGNRYNGYFLYFNRREPLSSLMCRVRCAYN